MCSSVDDGKDEFLFLCGSIFFFFFLMANSHYSFTERDYGFHCFSLLLLSLCIVQCASVVTLYSMVLFDSIKFNSRDLETFNAMQMKMEK